jgi:hypothetical protein
VAAATAGQDVCAGLYCAQYEEPRARSGAAADTQAKRALIQGLPDAVHGPSIQIRRLFKTARAEQPIQDDLGRRCICDMSFKWVIVAESPQRDAR